MIDLLTRAWGADPIVSFLAALAIVVIVLGSLVRPRGPDARFFIDAFAYLATIASVAKALKWALQRLATSAAVTAGGAASGAAGGAPGNGVITEPPGGTDILLILGSFLAIFLVSVQGLVSLFERKDGEPTAPLGRLFEAVGYAEKLPAGVKAYLGITQRQIEGERAAVSPPSTSPPVPSAPKTPSTAAPPGAPVSLPAAPAPAAAAPAAPAPAAAAPAAPAPAAPAPAAPAPAAPAPAAPASAAPAPAAPASATPAPATPVSAVPAKTSP